MSDNNQVQVIIRHSMRLQKLADELELALENEYRNPTIQLEHTLLPLINGLFFGGLANIQEDVKAINAISMIFQGKEVSAISPP